MYIFIYLYTSAVINIYTSAVISNSQTTHKQLQII